MFEFLKSFYLVPLVPQIFLSNLLIYSLNKYLLSANWSRCWSICYCRRIMNETDKNPWWGIRDEILSNLARYRLTEKLMFEWTPEEEEGVSRVDIWERRVLGRGNGNCKGPGAGIYLVYLKVAGSTWLEQSKAERAEGNGVGEAMDGKTKFWEDFKGYSKDFGFYSEWDGEPLEGFEQTHDRIWLVF